MPSVTREITIDAPPDVVRRHVTDPSERRRWLDDDVDDLAPVPGRDLEYTSPRGPGRVRIEVVPDGHGSRVRVTEQVELPGERPPGQQLPGPGEGTGTADGRPLACAA